MPLLPRALAGALLLTIASVVPTVAHAAPAAPCEGAQVSRRSGCSLGEVLPAAEHRRRPHWPVD